MEAKDTKEAARHIADVVNAFKIKNATFKPRHFRDCVTSMECLYYDKLHSYMVQNGYIIRERDGKDPLSRFTDDLVLGYEVFEKYINWRRGDTIKESKTMEKKSFAIPEGCKSVSVSEESGRLVIEFEEAKKFEPKKGDIIIGQEKALVIITEENIGLGIGYIGKFSKDVCLRYYENWRFANKEETAQLFAALENEGLKWNAETMEVERLRWKPTWGESYFHLNPSLVPMVAKWCDSPVDNGRFKTGNCCKYKKDFLPIIDKCRDLCME